MSSIDEVHLLAEERGATLEVIVSRMRSANPEIRFVAVSATVPNIEDVAVWLGPGKASPDRPVSKDADGKPLPPMARVMKFGDEFRPVPLQKYVTSYCIGFALNCLRLNEFDQTCPWISLWK